MFLLVIGGYLNLSYNLKILPIFVSLSSFASWLDDPLFFLSTFLMVVGFYFDVLCVMGSFLITHLSTHSSHNIFFFSMLLWSKLFFFLLCSFSVLLTLLSSSWMISLLYSSACLMSLVFFVFVNFDILTLLFIYFGAFEVIRWGVMNFGGSKLPIAL